MVVILAKEHLELHHSSIILSVCGAILVMKMDSLVMHLANIKAKLTKPIKNYWVMISLSRKYLRINSIILKSGRNNTSKMLSQKQKKDLLLLKLMVVKLQIMLS
ncbi:Uncharacterised protein [Mycobacterium tuberculosis]|nr:Uncharacterised protein [Mycobacterium tuberculosis]